LLVIKATPGVASRSTWSGMAFLLLFYLQLWVATLTSVYTQKKPQNTHIIYGCSVTYPFRMYLNLAGL